MAMSFGKGYLKGGENKSASMGGMMEHEPEEEGGEEGEATPMIHAHLKKMHEMTGKAHSHIEHHGDGTHSAHHVDEGGNVSGPHEHGDESTMADCSGGM